MTRFVRAALFALTTAALAATTLATIAQAETRTRFVPVAAYDLTTTAGQARLARRIGVAARQVCGPVEAFGTPDYAEYEQCVGVAEAGALRRARVLIAAAERGVRLADR